MVQRQKVTLHRVADRHADLHGREFGECIEVTPTLDEVLSALQGLGFIDPSIGAYTLTIDWPYDCEATDE